MAPLDSIWPLLVLPDIEAMTLFPVLMCCPWEKSTLLSTHDDEDALPLLCPAQTPQQSLSAEEFTEKKSFELALQRP